MSTRHGRAVTVVAIALLALSACSSGDADGGSGTDDGTAAAGGGRTDDGGGTEGGSGATLSTAEVDLGTIVVDGEGMTVYQFDSDEQGSGSSTCEGQCADNWPAVPGQEMPELDGVTGEVATITGVDGEPQLTLNGWPLYYYVGDEAPGDVTGQGVGDVWWVLTPEGEPIRE